jgi:response regulator RpfG family c-di-GMP phosphodiesterase
MDTNKKKKATTTTVMICDDEVDMLGLFKAALAPAYDVLAVDSGKDCIEKFVEEKHKGRKIDVLILDYRLGDMLGDIVACKIKELNGVKTILISAYDLDEEMVKDLIERKCIVGALKKPIRLQPMIEKIEQVMKEKNTTVT